MIEVEHLDFYYGKAKALEDISLKIPARRVTCLYRALGLRQIHVAAVF